MGIAAIKKLDQVGWRLDTSIIDVTQLQLSRMRRTCSHETHILAFDT